MLVITVSMIVVVKAVVFGDTMLDYCVEDYCVEGYIVGGCGVGGCCGGRFYVKSVVNGVFRRIKRMLLWNDRTV